MYANGTVAVADLSTTLKGHNQNTTSYTIDPLVLNQFHKSY